uniref:Uncharacterized protein n=1 Tax=Magallana gigas TaxID=29159 RepID=A0A8W8HQ56_MAGGI
MTSVWAVKEYSDNQGFLKSVTFGLWHFRRCGGFRINGECNKGELQQTDIQYFGAEVYDQEDANLFYQSQRGDKQCGIFALDLKIFFFEVKKSFCSSLKINSSCRDSETMQ